jgi:hypothetical protein
VEHAHRTDELDLEEQVPAERRIRRQRRDEVDGAENGRCAGGDPRDPTRYSWREE